jgi:signal transduction histidine kinase
MLIHQGFTIVATTTAFYYVEQIQEIVDETAEVIELHEEKITADNFIIDKQFNKRMYSLSKIIPFFSIKLDVNGEVAYAFTASQIAEEMVKLRGRDIDEETYLSIMEEFKTNRELNKKKNFEFEGTKVVETIMDHHDVAIGSVQVGIDSKIEYAMYLAVVLVIVLAGIVVVGIMRFITSFFTKPILKPIYKLQAQLDLLADENYDNINPSLIVDKRTVREIRELSDATNKLLTKMINYNEVITKSEKMASVGQLTAAITHEINTPLGVINANAGLMKMLTEEAVIADTTEDKQLLLESIIETADTTEEACGRIQEIIKSLRSYSRIDQADFMPASINESMKSVVTLTTNLHKNRINIIEEFGEVPDVNCYIGLVNQVFMNLIINAIQAIDGEGNITLRTTSDEQFVYASVIDTGCGIDLKDIYRVFEYGFTTKQPGSGSGIGLALSKNIVHKHNGEITIDSNVGVGSTITVRLPINQ